jgi:flavin reductase (DIM6/NTAB) family NADH-FMN oxidoreductase RutF
MHQTSAEYAAAVNELEVVGLTPLASTHVKPVRVGESPLQFECRLFNSMKVGTGKGSATIVVGEILAAHVWEKAYQNQRLLPDILAPVARLGGQSYTTLGRIFDLPPAKPEQPKS